MDSTRPMGRRKLGRERINITLPKGMPDELTAAAEERGLDRSRLLQELAEAYLKKRREREEKKGKGK
jgi:metal-responsive CopG/Arc/MetJ family transcriptional regulator